VYLFGSIWGTQMPQNSMEKTYFPVVFDHSFLENGPNDMVRGLSFSFQPIDLVKDLFLSLDTGRYISPNWGPLCTFLGQFRGAQMPQNSIKKTYFPVVLDHSFLENGPNDMVRGLSFSLDIGTYILPTYRPL
jgi:hypothetical protein